MEVWKIIFLSKWVICRFHVNLPGCILALQTTSIFGSEQLPILPDHSRSHKNSSTWPCVMLRQKKTSQESISRAKKTVHWFLAIWKKKGVQVDFGSFSSVLLLFLIDEFTVREARQQRAKARWGTNFWGLGVNRLHPLKLTVRTWKWMVGIRSFPFGKRPIFRCFCC